MVEFNFNDFNKLGKEVFELEIIKQLQLLLPSLRPEKIERTIKFLEKILTFNQVSNSQNIRELFYILKSIKISIEDYLTAFKKIKMTHLFTKVFSRYQDLFYGIIDGYYAFDLNSFLKSITNILKLFYEITFNELPQIIYSSASNTDEGFDESFEYITEIMLDQIEYQFQVKVEENKLKYNSINEFDGFTLNIEKVLEDKAIKKHWFKNHIRNYYEKDENLIILIRILQTTLQHDNKISKLHLNELFRNKSIEEVLKSIINQSSLKELSIQEDLSSLPYHFREFKSLKKLDLHSNKFSVYIPEPINHIESLLELNLASNQINSIPKSVLNLKKLKKLNLSNNKIQRLPDFIGNLQSLEYLNLSENDLKVLPDSICNLKFLKYLNLSDNLIRELPSRFGSLSSLEEFDISWNNLAEIPQSMRKAEALKLIRVENKNLAILRKLLKPLKDNQNMLIKYNYPEDSMIMVKELYKED